MRLSEHEREVITSVLRQAFGEDCRMLLFGSRTDDAARGGDIDLLVETRLPAADRQPRKIGALARMKLALGDRKIDLILTGKDEVDDRLVVREARRTGVDL